MDNLSTAWTQKNARSSTSNVASPVYQGSRAVQFGTVAGQTFGSIIFIILFICLFVYLFICLFVYLFICSFVHLFICSFVHLFICPFVHLFIYALMSQDLEFDYSGGVLSMAGKTHLRFAARAAQATSDLVVQASATAWTYCILSFASLPPLVFPLLFISYLFSRSILILY